MKVLIFNSHFFPGFKAGGPIRSLSNMIDLIGKDTQFFVVTSDRDLGDNERYNNIDYGLNKVGGAHVFYSDKSWILYFIQILFLFFTIRPNCIYLNSFFNLKYTVFILILRKIFFIKKIKIILAPRGELNHSALNIKKYKKQKFLKISKFLNLYNKITWHATSVQEKSDILVLFPQSNIEILSNVPLAVKIHDNNFQENILKIVFVGRISKMKNLNFCLNVFSQEIEFPHDKSIIFDIYGPIEDVVYWKVCQENLKKITGKNISVSYKGVLLAADVQSTIAQYDLLFLPTLGENYGQVIAESFSVGTPVLISNNTPWRYLDKDGLGWDLNLDNQKEFIRILQLMLNKSVKDRKLQRYSILKWSEKYLIEDKIVDKYLGLFKGVS